MQKVISLVVLGLGCGAVAPAWSQSAASQSVSNGRATPAREEAFVGVSVASLLQLQPAQIERLSPLANEFAARSRATQARATQAQTAASRVQGSSQGVSRDSRVAPDFEAERRKSAQQLGAIRLKAMQILPPVQRSQLDSLAADPRFRIRRDDFYQLLLAPIDELSAPPALASTPVPNRAALDEASRRNWLEARRLDGQSNLNRAAGVGSYGVYSGYGYGGPQLGVYGGYQQGAVGVHAGVGRGGPTIGINIGRIFGIGRR